MIGSLQGHIEEVRRRAREEMGRLRAEHAEETERLRTVHAAETERLQGEIEVLRKQCSNQDERLRELKEQIGQALEEYRTDLEARIEGARSAQARVARVRELSAAFSATAAGGGLPQAPRTVRIAGPRQGEPDPPQEHPAEQASDTSDSVFQPAAAPPSDWDTPPRPMSAGDTVSIPIVPPDGPAVAPTRRIAINGVNSVTSMMRARTAVEGVREIDEIESRSVSGGVINFTVRSRRSARELANALTALPDLPLRLLNVSEDAVELEM
jgi:predicted HicB family RNase H-like nuclease